MNKLSIVSSRPQNTYVYAEKPRYFLFVPDELQPYIEGERDNLLYDCKCRNIRL